MYKRQGLTAEELRLGQRLLDRLRELREPGRHIRPEMDAQRPAIAFREHLKIAARLRRFHDAKRVLVAGNGQIGGIVASDLDVYKRQRL